MKLSIDAHIREDLTLAEALAEIKFVQAVGGEVLGLEKIGEDDYTLRAVLPTKLA